MLNKRKCWQKNCMSVGLHPLPPAGHLYFCSTACSRSVFFDDRRWQSWVELRGSCLSSGCSVWCTFDVVQAHCRPRLWLLAYDTKLRQSWNLEGRKEGSTLPRQSTQFEKQQPVITQSVLIHCGIVQGFRCFVFNGFQKRKEELTCKIVLFSHTSSGDDINVSLTVCSSVELSDGLPFNLVNPCAADEYSYWLTVHVKSLKPPLFYLCFATKKTDFLKTV